MLTMLHQLLFTVYCGAILAIYVLSGSAVGLHAVQPIILLVNVRGL
jgi:hypothetical protein